MSENDEKRSRLVRATNPECSCGTVGHMTVDELKERALGADFDGSCPECGRIHLSRDEIEELEKEKIVESKAYQEMKKKAEA